MNTDCDCCQGTENVTPLATTNRPGLPALSCRVGTHATFLETMIARLSNLYLEIPEESLDQQGRRTFSRIYPLRDLKTRAAGDPAIALLDAWALVGDVLTFYQERIANEGFLRTATERRSILELARLIGYTLRPGVASSVYLAYTLDEDRSVTPPKPTSVTIPAGARSQSVPGPGELPQSFETSDKLEAGSKWNNLQVRLSRPQTEDSIGIGTEHEPTKTGPRVYLKGISTNLRPNDPLLIDFGSRKPELFRIIDVKPDAVADHTLVKLREWTTKTPAALDIAEVRDIVAGFRDAVRNAGLGNLAIVKKVTAHLTDLQTHLGTQQPVADHLAHFGNVTLANLRNELPAAEAHPRRAELVHLIKNLADDLTDVIQRSAAAATSPAGPRGSPSSPMILTDELFGPLSKPPSVPPASSARLGRDTKSAFTKHSDVGLQLLASFQPALSDLFPTALANAQVTEASAIKVYTFHVKAAPFGIHAQKRSRVDRDSGEITEIGEWPIVKWSFVHRVMVAMPPFNEKPKVIDLDSSYDKIIADSTTIPSWIVIDSTAWEQSKDPEPQVTPARLARPLIGRIAEVQADISRSDYGISGKTTSIKLVESWLRIAPHKPRPDDFQKAQAMYDVDFRVIRSTVVYAQSEELDLAEEPINDPVCGGKDTTIELNGLHSGLQSGRWLIVSGERTDITNGEGIDVPGVKATELVMLAGVTQDIAWRPDKNPLAGDKIHTFIQLAENLAYCYKRDTVIIYGNVVKATNGETRNEVLGSGDGSRELQQFALRQPPLTFVAAPNPSGVDSTLQLRVNDVLWHETDSLADLLPTDRKFITRTDNNGKTTAMFGTGEHGARLPTGQENVKAVYRNGIGKAGNVKADQVSLLATRPLGAKAVTNPLPATGGADKENRDQARQNVPLAVMALDRLVSTQDYADFARTFAGIGKASAVRLSDGLRQLVHVTIAGTDDIPIAKTSDLYRNLVKALRDFGDPYLPIQVETRELMLLVIQANVRVLPDYQWESVEATIRAALLDAFSFQRSELGLDALLSKAISVMQRVAGAEYVDVDVFGGIPSIDPDTGKPATPDQITNKVKDLAANPKSPLPRVTVMLAQQKGGGIHPAQLAFLTPDVPATLILNEVTR